MFMKNRKELSIIEKSDTYTHGAVPQVGSTDTMVEEENNEQRSVEIFFKDTSIVMATLGCLLIAKDLGITYDPVKPFCKQGKKTNYDAVCQSEVVHLFGKVTFSNLLTPYFIFQLFVLSLFIPFYETVSVFWIRSLTGFYRIPQCESSLQPLGP